MNQIPKEYIVPFIAQLYKERKHEDAPAALLYNWSQVPDNEIDNKLSQLFQHWGMSDREKSLAIDRFLDKVMAKPSAATLESNIPVQKPTATDFISEESIARPYTAANNYSERKRVSPFVWILVFVIFAIGGFLGVRYMQYASLSYVYAITENITVRDAKGNAVARMDLYEKSDPQATSYSMLRAMDDKVYYMQYAGMDKEYPNRKVMMDSVGFWDYLFKGNEIAHYVNTNYVVNDKAEFDLYQTVFSDVKKLQSDNKNLVAVQRKVIVGSMAKDPLFKNKFISTNQKGMPTNQLPKTQSIIVQELKANQHYVIVAGLDDGNYYRFEGDIKSNDYKAPQLMYKVKDGNKEPLNGQYRFGKVANVWALYDVKIKTLTHYEIRQDADNKYAYFEYNEPEPISISNPIDSLIDTIKEIFN